VLLRTLKVVVLVLVVAAGTGAGAMVLEPRPHDDERLVDRLREAYATASGGRIDARELYDGRWDRVDIFSPQKPRRATTASLGRIDGADELPPGTRRDRALAVFRDGRSVVAAVELERSTVDVGCLDAAGPIAPDEELVVVTAPARSPAPLLARPIGADCPG
jgi:hypothetical protein